MSPDKRRGREAARRRAAVQQARELKRRQRRRMQVAIVGILGIVVVLAVLLAAIGGGGDDDDAADLDAFDDTDTTVDETDETIADDPPDTDEEFTYGTGECAPDRKPETRPATFEAAPQQCLKEGADYIAVVGTSEGAFTIDLLEERSPGTVNNFVQLARWAWYDGDDFHRVVPGFVIQGGDPVGQGEGNPGYMIADELSATLDEYLPGAVAMANSGPDTNGSQWFVCVDCSQLPSPAYSLFGQVTDGMDVVEKINATQGGEVQIVAIDILEDPLGEG